MKYAVIESGGKQYIASVGQVLTVDKIDKKEGENYDFAKVLLLRQDDKLLIGTPDLKGIKVSGKVLKQYKGDKIEIRKFKAKVHYRRKMGFRPLQTDIKIEGISQTDKTVRREKQH